MLCNTVLIWALPFVLCFFSLQVPHDHHMATLHIPLSSLDEWWKADICTVMQEDKNQVTTKLIRKRYVTGGYGIYCMFNSVTYQSFRIPGMVIAQLSHCVIIVYKKVYLEYIFCCNSN